MKTKKLQNLFKKMAGLPMHKEVFFATAQELAGGQDEAPTFEGDVPHGRNPRLPVVHGDGAGVLAAAAAASQAAEAKIPGTQVGASAAAGAEASDPTIDGTDRIGQAMRVGIGGGCGCAPCWGPPAPPAMRPELLDAFADLDAEEVAA